MNQNKEIELKLVSELKDKEAELQNIIDKYVEYNNMFLWMKIAAVGLPLLIVCYNLVFAGKRYPIDEYNEIRNTFGGIAGFIILIVIVIGIFAIIKYYDVIKLIKNLAMSRQMKYSDLKKEMNILLKATVGGYGL